MQLPIAGKATVKQELLRLAKQYRGELVFTIFLQFVVALCAVAIPWLIGTTIDVVVTGIDRPQLLHYLSLLIAVVAVQATVVWWADFKARALGQKLLHELRARLVDAVTNLPIAVVERAGTGDLLGRTTTDIDRVELIFRVGVSRMIVLIFTAGVSIVAVFMAHVGFGLLLVLFYIPYVFVVKWYVHSAVGAYLASSVIFAQISGEVSETAEQSETVDAQNLRDYRVRHIGVYLAEMWDNERYTAWMRVLFIAGTVLVLGLPVLVMVILGALFIGWGWVTVGTVVTVVLYAQQLRFPVEELGWWSDELSFAAVAFGRIFGVFELNTVAGQSTSAPNDAQVKITDLSFSYREDYPVLQKVNLLIPSGTSLAIVGPSGAGKSTLGRLIAGSIAPSHGKVQIGGVEVSELAGQNLHSTVALVTQENHVFAGSIAQNLQLADPQADAEQMWAVLSAVEASWVHDLPQGLETMVGSGALELSPDKAQQLALARILLLDPKVLILDEATSLLDPRSARATERALVQVMRGRTVISIAHRLYTAYDADQICVVKNGGIAEIGSHQELVAQNGEYASLWRVWQQG